MVSCAPQSQRVVGTLPATRAAQPTQKLLYVMTNFMLAKEVDETIDRARRAAKVGYTHIVLVDSKFCRWDWIERPAYDENVKRLVRECRAVGLKVLAGVCPFGYSEDILASDPNLVEALPVVGAPFLNSEGQLIPVDQDLAIVNGSFEESAGDKPAGWSIADAGKSCFIDQAVFSDGKASLRMDASLGGCAVQKINCEPFRYYRVSVMVKTRDLKDVGSVILTAINEKDQPLCWEEYKVEPTQEFKPLAFTLNTQDSRKIQFRVGVRRGGGGTIWFDNLKVEPGGWVNLVRRAGAPLKFTSMDGQTVYEEGRDCPHIADPKLGQVPFRGIYQPWYEQPKIPLPWDSRIRPAQKVRVSYYHALPIALTGNQVTACMAEPKVYELLAKNLRQVRDVVRPDGYYMEHDEMRCGGWDESCRKTGLTPGQLLASNVRRCVEMIHAEDPGKPIYVWSDMFDPTHNATKDGKTYFYVKGVDPWYGSWEGLPSEVTVISWAGGGPGRVESLRHFARRGNQVIICGYPGGNAELKSWINEATGVGNFAGIMYVTWSNDFTKIEEVGEVLPSQPSRR